MIAPDRYEDILACWLSDQMSESQWLQHLEDEVFAAWVRRKLMA